MKRQILLLIILFFSLSKSFAQHTGHHNHDTVKSKLNDNTVEPMDSMQMSHSFSRNLSMNRNGSGTSWQPNSTPVYAYMKHLTKWNFMLH